MLVEGPTATGARRVEWLIASHGAEDLLAGLALSNQIDAVVTTDSDIVGLQAPLAIRLDLSGGRFFSFSMRSRRANGTIPPGPSLPIMAGLSSADYLLMPHAVRARDDLYRLVQHGGEAFGMEVCRLYNDGGVGHVNLPLDLGRARSAVISAVSARVQLHGAHDTELLKWIESYAEALVASMACYVYPPVPLVVDGGTSVQVVPLTHYVASMTGGELHPWTDELRRWWEGYVDVRGAAFGELLQRQGSLEADSPLARLLEGICCPPPNVTLDQDATARLLEEPRRLLPRTGSAIASGSYGGMVCIFRVAVKARGRTSPLTVGAQKVSVSPCA